MDQQGLIRDDGRLLAFCYTNVEISLTAMVLEGFMDQHGRIRDDGCASDLEVLYKRSRVAGAREVRGIERRTRTRRDFFDGATLHITPPSRWRTSLTP